MQKQYCTQRIKRVRSCVISAWHWFSASSLVWEGNAQNVGTEFLASRTSQFLLLELTSMLIPWLTNTIISLLDSWGDLPIWFAKLWNFIQTIPVVVCFFLTNTNVLLVYISTAIKAHWYNQLNRYTLNTYRLLSRESIMRVDWEVSKGLST